MDHGEDLGRLVDDLYRSDDRSTHKPTPDQIAAVRQAWTDSTDAPAMLLLLARLYPERREPEVAALARRLARVAPSHSRIPETARLIVRDLGLSGARSGPDRYRFLHLASRVRSELAEMRSGETVGATYDVTVPDLNATYATAIRELVADPYVLPVV
jgi:hypothetical protein